MADISGRWLNNGISISVSSSRHGRGAGAQEEAAATYLYLRARRRAWDGWRGEERGGRRQRRRGGEGRICFSIYAAAQRRQGL